MRILLVEDNEEQIILFHDALKYFIEDHPECDIELINCNNYESAVEKLKEPFDGLILDLNLKDKVKGIGGVTDLSGLEIKKIITSLNDRIPIVYASNDKEKIDELEITEGLDLKTDKVDIDYTDIIKHFWELQKSYFNILFGNNGIIENQLNNILKKVLLPEAASWRSYKNSLDPELYNKALTRYSLNHLQYFLRADGEKCVSHEVYINTEHCPEDSDQKLIKTGRIIKCNETNEYYIIMSPACDIAIRNNGKRNSTHLTLIKIYTLDDAVTLEAGDKVNEKQKENLITNFKNNNKGLCYKYLNSIPGFDEGVVNFRSLKSVPINKVKGEYSFENFVIAPAFLKNLQSCFASYYARQGQPEIHKID